MARSFRLQPLSASMRSFSGLRKSRARCSYTLRQSQEKTDVVGDVAGSHCADSCADVPEFARLLRVCLHLLDHFVGGGRNGNGTGGDELVHLAAVQGNQLRQPAPGSAKDEP